MKVLHFIPNFADINESVGLQYKIALIKAMAESAEVHLLCADYPGIDMGSVHVHKFSLLKNLFGRWHSSFKKFWQIYVRMWYIFMHVGIYMHTIFRDVVKSIEFLQS